MTGEIGSIGEAVTAGLTGAAVEPGHGGGTAQAGARCLNCGTTLAGSHCHRCGQKAHVHRSLTGIGHDLVHAILHFDGKFWNTLPLLVWRPGDLTRRYIHGERASFISPLALFLFAVFLTYAVLASVGMGGSGFDAFSEAERQETINGARDSMRDSLAKVDRQLAAAKAAGQPVAALQRERDGIVTTARTMGLLDDTGPLPMISETARRDFSVTDLKTGIKFIDKAIGKANENPGLLLYKLQANAYKFAWALIPLSMPFLWLLFPFSRRFHMFDHFVFVTYSISFMLLWFVMLRLASFLPESINGPVYAVGIPYIGFHMYRQLRGAYRSSRLGAMLRTLLLLFFCSFTVIMFLLLLVAMGIMG
jgi:Protein of unknown function (DUF3667)